MKSCNFPILVTILKYLQTPSSLKKILVSFKVWAERLSEERALSCLRQKQSKQLKSSALPLPIPWRPSYRSGLCLLNSRPTKVGANLGQNGYVHQGRLGLLWVRSGEGGKGLLSNVIVNKE